MLAAAFGHNWWKACSKRVRTGGRERCFPLAPEPGIWVTQPESRVRYASKNKRRRRANRAPTRGSSRTPVSVLLKNTALLACLYWFSFFFHTCLYFRLFFIFFVACVGLVTTEGFVVDGGEAGGSPWSSMQQGLFFRPRCGGAGHPNKSSLQKNTKRGQATTVRAALEKGWWWL